MAKCPYCNSKDTSCTNWFEVIGSNILGGIAGGVAGLFNPSMSTPVHMKSAERKYETAKAEYNKWKGMKPDEFKGFVNDAEWHMKQAQYHSDRGEFSDASDHLKSAKMCTQ